MKPVILVVSLQIWLSPSRWTFTRRSTFSQLSNLLLLRLPRLSALLWFSEYHARRRQFEVFPYGHCHSACSNQERCNSQKGQRSASREMILETSFEKYALGRRRHAGNMRNYILIRFRRKRRIDRPCHVPNARGEFFSGFFNWQMQRNAIEDRNKT